MKPPKLWACLLLASILVAPADASELSKRLYNKGLVAFHAGDLKTAMELFDAAVAADANDPLAHYYRGVTRARQGDRNAAIADLRRALQLKPDLFDAALDLGIALIEAGEFTEAKQVLEIARNAPALEAQACLYIGIALFRSNRYDEARSYLECARERDPTLAAVALYYLGLADIQESRWRSARAHLRAVLALQADTPVAQEAQELLSRLDREERARLRLYAGTGLQYDSNVILAPSGELGAALAKSDVGVTRQADGRATFLLGGQYAIAQTRQARLLAGYEFYQSVHFTLRSFDLQGHRGSVQLSRRSGVAEFGLLGRYDYYLLDLDDFLREGTVLPYARVTEGTLGSTEVSFQLRRRDFLKPEFHVRDAFNYAPAIAQNFCVRRCDRVLAVSYQFDAEETEPGLVPRAFAYHGHQVGVGLSWAFPFEFKVEADYAFRHETYDREASGGRKDQEHLTIFLARKALSEHIDFVFGYYGQVNFTNSVQIVNGVPQKLFEYERYIGTIGIEARY